MGVSPVGVSVDRFHDWCLQKPEEILWNYGYK